MTPEKLKPFFRLERNGKLLQHRDKCELACAEETSKPVKDGSYSRTRKRQDPVRYPSRFFVAKCGLTALYVKPFLDAATAKPRKPTQEGLPEPTSVESVFDWQIPTTCDSF